MIKKDFTISPITKFVIWLFLGLIVCIIGISNVFALENNNRIFFYDNLGSSATAVTTSYIEQTDESSATFTTTANSYGGLVLIQLNAPLVKNHIYTLFLNVGAANNGGSTQLSTKNCIGIGTGYSNTINSYVNCSVTPQYSTGSGQTTDKGRGLYFTFIASDNGTYIAVPYTSRYTCTNCLQYSYGYEIIDAGDSTNLDQTQLNNVINQQTTNINNAISNTETNLRNALTETEENINNTINDNFQTCSNILNINSYNSNSSNFATSISNSVINITPNVTGNSYAVSTYYNLSLQKNTDYTIKFNLARNHMDFRIYIYHDSMAGANQIITNNFNDDSDFTFNTGNYTNIIMGFYVGGTSLSSGDYVRLSDFELIGCVNKLDQQTDAINGINDSINNDNVDENGIASAFDSFNNYLDDNSTITQLIALPVTLYTAILNNLNSTCQPFNLGNLYGSDLILPCINISQYLGNSLWSMIDIIISGFAIYAISKKMIKVFNNFSSLREGDVIDD